MVRGVEYVLRERQVTFIRRDECITDASYNTVLYAERPFAV